MSRRRLAQQQVVVPSDFELIKQLVDYANEHDLPHPRTIVVGRPVIVLVECLSDADANAWAAAFRVTGSAELSWKEELDPPGGWFVRLRSPSGDALARSAAGQQHDRDDHADGDREAHAEGDQVPGLEGSHAGDRIRRSGLLDTAPERAR